MKLDIFDFPDKLKYLKGHIWLDVSGRTAKIGVTSLGSSLAKEIVHVDLPEAGKEFGASESIASYETIKSVTQISIPLKLRVTGVNERLLDEPSIINTDCYGDGWIAEVEFTGEPGGGEGSLMGVGEAVEYYGKVLGEEKERYSGIYDD